MDHDIELYFISLIGRDHAVTTTATTSGNADPAITLEDLVKVSAELDAMVAKCDAPLRTWMIERGYDPKDGYVVYLPMQLRDEFGVVPSFVRFSMGVTAPMITKDVTLNMYNFKFNDLYV